MQNLLNEADRKGEEGIPTKSFSAHVFLDMVKQ